MPIGHKPRPSLRSVEERNRLVQANLPLVPWTVHRFFPTRDEDTFQDRVQAGRLGLIRAAELFDEGRGCTFSTYAVRWVRQAIQRDREFHSGAPLIRVPRCAQRDGVQVPQVRSLDEPVRDDYGATLGDLIPAAPDASGSSLEDRDLLARLLDGLAPDERRVFVLRHPDDCNSQGRPKVRSWPSIVEEVGLPYQQVRALYAGALARLREGGCPGGCLTGFEPSSTREQLGSQKATA
jgi:RNA polymerase sigma factor (sigma-70 family)